MMIWSWCCYVRAADTSVPSAWLNLTDSSSSSFSPFGSLLLLGAQRCSVTGARGWSHTECEEGWTDRRCGVRKDGRTDVARQSRRGSHADWPISPSHSLQLLSRPPVVRGPVRPGPQGLQQVLLTVLFLLPQSRKSQNQTGNCSPWHCLYLKCQSF